MPEASRLSRILAWLASHKSVTLPTMMAYFAAVVLLHDHVNSVFLLLRDRLGSSMYTLVVLTLGSMILLGATRLFLVQSGPMHRRRTATPQLPVLWRRAPLRHWSLASLFALFGSREATVAYSLRRKGKLHLKP